MDLITRFERFFQKSRGCWIWQGAKRSDVGRYGCIKVDGKHRAAHRVAYELYVGPIPPGLDVLHDCPSGDNSLCVNPKHLWTGTPKDNAKDRESKGRGAHKKGAAHGMAKLTAAGVRAIRRDRRSSKEIARDYGLNRSHVSAIKAGRSWSHIPGAKPLGKGTRTDLTKEH